MLSVDKAKCINMVKGGVDRQRKEKGISKGCIKLNGPGLMLLAPFQCVLVAQT